MKWVDPATFFDVLPQALDAARPLPGEKALYALVRSVLDAAAADRSLRKVLKDAAAEADEALVKPLLQFRNFGIPLPHNWTTVINSAEFGTDYLTRTAVAKSNVFINRPRETRYFYQYLDQRGSRLPALANFATVDEVREAVKTIVIVPTTAPGLGSPQGAVAGAHFFLQDKSGKSLVVEPVDGTLKVHDAPLGVMTNAPTYDWHMTNLSNYVNLSVHDIDQTKVGGVTVPAFGAGTGLLGLPGDFTPPSRFVRAVVYSKAAVPNQTAEDTMFTAFHILNQFDIPKGSVMNSAVGEPTAEITEWTSVADLKNLRWYFRTREDQSIRVVDLKQALDAAKGEVATIEMEASRQPYTNVSGEAKKLDTVAN